LRIVIIATLLVSAAMGAGALAEEQGTAGTPFEVVREHVDVDVDSDGTYVETREVGFRALDATGQKMMQERSLSYIDGLQNLEVESAYTLKSNGEKIDVPANRILRGYGATSKPGFEDARTITIIYSKLDVGDETFLVTRLKQKTSLFKGHFAQRQEYARSIKISDVQVTLTAPQDFPLKIDAMGLSGGDRQSSDGKFRWFWTYGSPAPTPYLPDNVIGPEDEPHLAISSLPDYAAVASAYVEHFKGKATVTSDIQALADGLTSGLTDRRAQAEAIYDWVSRNISYVNIVLGAGGFTPHAASDVLRTRYGDCKDHVMLLEALLAAKGIQSGPVLISSGGSYALSKVPSPYYFNHLIAYVPEFQLFLDSTARYVPFGVLPTQDADRPVLLVATGELSTTPRVSAENSTISVTVAVKFDADGSAEGHSSVTAKGDVAYIHRALVGAIPSDRESEVFRTTLGPGSETHIDRGNLDALADPLSYTLNFRIPSVAVFPGPGAVSRDVGFQPVSFVKAITGTLPPSRSSPYACSSVTATETATYDFPATVKVTAVPKPTLLQTEDIRLDAHFQIKTPHAVIGVTNLRIDHPRGFCTPEYYGRVRSSLAQMAANLRGQILYK
jgi:transglutaminase-like putative cysteine protease